MCLEFLFFSMSILKKVKSGKLLFLLVRLARFSLLCMFRYLILFVHVLSLSPLVVLRMFMSFFACCCCCLIGNSRCDNKLNKIKKTHNLCVLVLLKFLTMAESITKARTLLIKHNQTHCLIFQEYQAQKTTAKCIFKYIYTILNKSIRRQQATNVI